MSQSPTLSGVSGDVRAGLCTGPAALLKNRDGQVVMARVLAPGTDRTKMSFFTLSQVTGKERA